MRVFLFFSVFSCLSYGMDSLKTNTTYIPGVIKVECLRNRLIFIRDFPSQRKQNIYDHDVNTGKTRLVHSVKNGSIYLSPIDDLQKKCIFQVSDNYSHRVHLMIYDLEQQNDVDIKKYDCFAGCDAWWDEDQENIVLFGMNGRREVFRQNSTRHWKDEQLTHFFRAMDGSIVNYNPKTDTVLSYCTSKKGYYYGKVSDFNPSANVLPYNFCSYCYLAETIAKIPLMIRFCKCEDRKRVCATTVLVFNILKNTCVKLENAEPILSADINDNIVATLSRTAKLRFFDVKQQKCVWGPYAFYKNRVNFSERQTQLSSKLISLFPDGDCTIALPNKLVKMPVPFKVLYGIRERKLMAIISALKNCSIYIPRDILWLLVSKIIVLPAQ